MNFISIVIPVHNESDNIKNLIEEIVEELANESFEIIVVDDCSTDNTLSLLLELKETTPSLRIIHNAKNLGQSGSVYTGVSHAKGDIIATLDGDGQNMPKDIPKMVEVLINNEASELKMVVGWRKKRIDSKWRVFSSKLVNSFRSWLLKDQTPDTGCGLKVFYKNAFMTLPFFDHMHRFLPALIQSQGGKVISVEVGHRPRTLGNSHYGTIDRLLVGIIDIFGVAWLCLRAKKFNSEER